MQKKFFFLLGISLFMPSYGYAYNSYNVPGENFSYVIDVYNEGEGNYAFGEYEISPFNIQKNYIYPLFTAGQKWASVIKAPNNKEPVSYSVFGLSDFNASAGSDGVVVEGNPYKIAYVNAAINGLEADLDPEDLEMAPTNGAIFIGYGIDEARPGWQSYTGCHSLYHGTLADMHTVMLHELMHSLGISSEVSQYKIEEGDDTYYFTDDSDEDDNILSVFDKDLRIYTGDMDEPFDAKSEIAAETGMSVGSGEDFDVFEHAPYFVGEKTIKVLAGIDDYDQAREAIIDNGGLTNYSTSYDEKKEYPQVYGMPIHNADGDADDEDMEIDLSHLELRNSYMSHQGYRNWLVPMEAELAVLQDIGYDIELREFFGKSYYLNGITDTFTTGYSEWDGSAYTGEPNTATQGVGLHIYGNENNILQASDILTAGEGSIGVRIDGVGNKYTLAGGNKIQADGVENLGLAVTWGKNHIIDIENGAEIRATGDKGIAVSFDFGVNMFGAFENKEGSYINLTSYNEDPSAETDDVLVSDFNVAGSLEGSAAAIYISDNSHVENINILKDAQIKGDIISDWNSVKSGPRAKVQVFIDDRWDFVDYSDESQVHFTNLNISDAYAGTIEGNIVGDSERNTLKLHNAGDLTVSGDSVGVYTIDNSGIINFDTMNLAVSNGSITGDGVINISTSLETSGDLAEVENKLNFAEGSSFSTLNDEIQTIAINRLNTDNTEVSFDLGDEFNLENPSTTNTATIGQIKLSPEIAEQMDDEASVQTFSTENILDFGDSSANVYYNGNRYTLQQSDKDERYLTAYITAQKVELADAAEDKTAANYIVTEEKLSKDAGTIKGEDFEISGQSIDIDGHKGLVINKKLNSGGTVLKTDIFGAADSALSVINGGELEVDASDRELFIGNEGETAIKLNNGFVKLNADENEITVNGDIVGTNAKTDIVDISGNAVNLNNLHNIYLGIDSEETYLNNQATATVFEAKQGTLYVLQDGYLSDAGNNQIIFSGGNIDLANDTATDIELAQMVLNNEFGVGIDIDLKNLAADKFVFADSADLQTNNNVLVISEVNVINDDAVLSSQKYLIPFVSADSHNEELLDNVVAYVDAEFVSPIFNYTLSYSEDDSMGAFVLSRGDASDYSSYNPAVTVSPVAAQLGGYLSQINSYNQVFGNLDMQMLPLRTKARQADYKDGGLASGDEPKFWRQNTVWFNPYTSHERVDLKRGPKVRNNMYGAFTGVNSPLFATSGWEYQYSAYAGYNGSRQRYDGNLIRQNGGNLGVSGAWFKDDLFTMLTANVGTSFAKAYTDYGHEHFKTLLGGIASKTGYNWQLAKGKYAIQPNCTVSYSLVKTLDYTNAAGVKINSEPMHVINLAPEIKAIANFQNGWQPYASARMVWNIFDKTDFQAQHVDMPEMSVKPYVEYGAGMQKRWGEKVSGYGQIMRRDGGRDGIAIEAGFSWAFGK